MGKLLLGIDEAGRGSVIGPLIVGGVLIDREKLKDLEELNVKDSKLLSKKRREDLFPKIEEIAKQTKIVISTAQEIDQMMNVGINLNEIEKRKFLEVINELDPDEVIIDCPSVNEEKFGRKIKNLIENDSKVKVEHKADENYPVVSAASIIAKVVRDRNVEEIKEETGIELKTGYSHDKESIEFIKDSFERPEIRKYIRKNWSTHKRLKDENEQSKLEDY